MIPEDEAENELKDWYDKLREPSGSVDNILRIHSINTSTLKGHYEFYSLAMKCSKDHSRKHWEMIAVVVSNVNQCHYWIVHHGARLRKITRDTEFVDKFIEDYKNADIFEQDNTMLDYVVKLS